MIVKVCGITGLDDARMCLDAGADWIGLNLVTGPRRINLVTAVAIVEALDDPRRAVGLLRLAGPRIPRGAMRLCAAGVRRFQLYGRLTSESLARLKKTDLEVIAVLAIRSEEDLRDACGQVAGWRTNRPAFALLDSKVKGKLGGTGVPGNWEAIAGAQAAGSLRDLPPLLLAGGLTAENVGAAIGRIRPAGVDVCSGVESVPGRKDSEKVRAFIVAVRAAREPGDAGRG